MSEVDRLREYTPSPGFVLEDAGSHFCLGYTSASGGEAGADLVKPKHKQMKIDQIYVGDTHQRSGLGTIMLEEIKRFASSLGMKELTGVLDTGSPSARPFLEKNGFKFKNLKDGSVEVSLKI